MNKTAALWSWNHAIEIHRPDFEAVAVSPAGRVTYRPKPPEPSP